MKSHIKIGTRGSQLALYQAELVKTKIQEQFPMYETELVIIKTSGDMVRRGLDYPFETKRIFTREIEEALVRKEIDLAVHSAKDLAVDFPEGLKIGAVLEREDARDCLISKDKLQLAELPLGARIGTSSMRRKMQLRRLYPEIILEDVRGNVDTRIRKIEEGHYDAIVLAYAGMKRLGLTHYVSEIFEEAFFYPAPGQGAIVVECRSESTDLDEVLPLIHHELSGKRLECERAFLKRLEGGCQLPCGISSRFENGAFTLKGALFSIERREWVEAAHLSGSEPEKAGIEMAEMILSAGGQAILDEIREQSRKHKRE